MEFVLAYSLLGAFAGLCAGLLGIGGGVIVVPVLVYLFGLQGFGDSNTTHLAVGTSLATVAVAALAATRAHHRRGAVRWTLLSRMLPTLLVGAVAGVLLAEMMSSVALKRVFGGFEILIAIQLATGLGHSADRILPGNTTLRVGGGVIGTLSSMLGIGGGTLTVPFLSWFNVPLREAIATASACGLPPALMGTALFMVVGRQGPGLPELATGYLYWPAFLGIAVTSLLLAPVGAHLAHRLPVTTLRRVFAVLLAVIGVEMLITG